MFARETSFEQLLEMQEKLNAVIEERREEAGVRQQGLAQAQRQELLQLIAGGVFTGRTAGLSEDAQKNAKRHVAKSAA